MANYNISSNVRWELKNSTDRILNNYAAIAERSCPLTQDEVTRAVIPPRVQEYMTALRDMNCRFWHTRTFNCVVEPYGPVTRGTLVQLTLRHNTPYCWEAQADLAMARAIFTRRMLAHKDQLEQPIFFDHETLDPDKAARFGKWLEEATLQRRRVHGAKKLIHEFFNFHCNSTAELLTRWPGLRVLFKQLGVTWAQRILDAPVRQMSRWNWSSGGKATFEFYLENERRMGAADALLQGAAMLYTTNEARIASEEVQGHVDMWDRAPVALADGPEAA